MSKAPKLLSTHEIQKHNSIADCWIVVDGQVWDLTEFAPEHPGGAGIITKHAGSDATEAYSSAHPATLLPKTLTTAKLVGTLDTSTIDHSTWSKPPPSQNPQVQLEHDKPPLHSLLSAYDIEEVAKQTLSKKTWAFYSSAATDLITTKANKRFYDKIWFRPRILRNVGSVDTRCRIQDIESSLPVFVAPAAMAKMVHKDGETGIARGCHAKGILQCISNNASFPVEDIVAATPGHPFFFQLYVNRDRRKSEDLLRHVWKLGIRTIFLTVDAPVSGKREADERVKADEGLSAPMSSMKSTNDKKGGGLGRIMGSYIDSMLCWEDLAWLRRAWKGRIVLKGVQTAADARRAVEEGIEGIVVSNHGGRSLDTSSPGILVLLEFQKCCPEIFDHLEVYIDGGIRRGTDILKAICLGATAVSIGRTFLYALNYGSEGIEHFIDILYDELRIAMQMVGITSLDEAHPGLLNTAGIDHLVPEGEGHPYAKRRGRMRAKL